jgi:hypothetical protein
MEPGGTIFVVGQVLEDSCLSPWQAVGLNIAFLSIYDEGQAYTEGEHRTWLGDAGFSDIEVRWGDAPGGASLITARKIG